MLPSIYPCRSFMIFFSAGAAKVRVDLIEFFPFEIGISFDLTSYAKFSLSSC